jgi:adenine-specific DNA-methyltransferase
MDESFTDTTMAWMAAADLSWRKARGQYMTPRALRQQLLERVRLFPGIRVLDPGCGTGEFLQSVLELEPSASVTGWDVDPTILNVASQVCPNAQLVERDALEPYLGPPFDLIIGNPPYFQFKASREVRRHFCQVISGRPNIFSLFFQIAFDALKASGQVAYVVPPSMNCGAYFESLRRFIVARSSISFLEIIEDPFMFADAQTAVQLIVLNAPSSDDQYQITVRRPCGFSRTIFTPNAEQLSARLTAGRSLAELGFRVRTGSVVWNQHRAKLRLEQTETATTLLWAHNIVDGAIKLEISNPKKPQFIENVQELVGPAIVVNRIVGSVGSTQMRVGIVPDGFRFVAENHVNVIFPEDAVAKRLIHEVRDALLDPEVARTASLVTGNTQISATELQHLTPLNL